MLLAYKTISGRGELGIVAGVLELLVGGMTVDEILNATGKAKQILKAADESVLVSTYEALSSLERIGQFYLEELLAWKNRRRRFTKPHRA